MERALISLRLAALTSAISVACFACADFHGVKTIHCKVTERTAESRGLPVGSVWKSDDFEGCLLGEVIVCPEEAGSAYDNIRCGEVQTGSVRRDVPTPPTT